MPVCSVSAAERLEAPVASMLSRVTISVGTVTSARRCARRAAVTTISSSGSAEGVSRISASAVSAPATVTRSDAGVYPIRRTRTT
jgi:hypothetical protein